MNYSGQVMLSRNLTTLTRFIHGNIIWFSSLINVANFSTDILQFSRKARINSIV